ncbi:MYXO-CTERM sorting domain-containing protein [Chondromyces crocatus]|nr:MYXO-CTERM sorting domain-containing protein [Chondromyces crocatus]
MRNLALALTTALLTLLQTTDVLACKCVPPPPVATALEQSEAVFAGKVVGIAKQSSDETVPLVVKLDVSRAWKGKVGSTVEVRTATSSAACGLYFEEGKEWLIYAGSREGSLVASLCSRSKLFDTAAEDVAQLGEGTVPEGAAPPPAGSGEPPPGSEPPPPVNSPPPPIPGNEPPPVPPGANGCACEVAEAGGSPWGFAVALAGVGAVAARRRARASERQRTTPRG